ncbi:MAG: hypothetical protein ACTIOI_02850, partial [Pseudomonas helleri]
LTIYKRSGDTFTKLANTGVLLVDVQSVQFSSDERYLVTVGNTSPFLATYKRSGDTFIKVPDPAVLSGGGATVSVYVGPANFMDTFIAVGGASSNLAIYRDGYPFDPYTQFQVPLPAGLNGPTPPANTVTAYPMVQLKPYIKAKVSA